MAFSGNLEVSTQNRHIYALHREAQWSIQRLHNTRDYRYHPKGALASNDIDGYDLLMFSWTPKTCNEERLYLRNIWKTTQVGDQCRHAAENVKQLKLLLLKVRAKLLNVFWQTL